MPSVVKSWPPDSANEAFIDQATSGFEAYRAGVEPYTLAYAERETGVPAGPSASWRTLMPKPIEP